MTRNILKSSLLALGLFLSIEGLVPSVPQRPIFSRKALTRFEFSQAHMGTEFKIVLYALDANLATQASDAAFSRIAMLDAIMSDYNPGSELTRLCNQAGGPPVPVSEDLFRVLAQAQQLAEQSHGAFDITVGPVVRLWRRARARRQMPDPMSLAQALDLVGYKNLRLDQRQRTAQLLKPGMLLDLGGIAKGYAADEAIAVLKARGIQSALVAGAGDIRTAAPPPDRKGWLIAIAPLDPADKSEGRFFLLHDGAVSTSGDAEQHLEIAGVRYSHIVDPRTGMGLTGHSSVTVVAPNAITADSLATAASVLGADGGLELVKSVPGAGLLYVQKTESGDRSYSARFPRLFTEEEVTDEGER